MIFLIENILKVFTVSFALNVVWEFSHCWLYTTIHKMKTGDILKLLLKMSVKDGVWISVFYLITLVIFQNANQSFNWIQAAVFAVISLVFAFVDEKISVNMGRWEYSPQMPLVYGVGLTPLLELAVTGILAFWIVSVIL